VTTSNTYDAIAYTNESYPLSHPDRLAALARLHGLKPTNVECCRVLEIGCGRGGNLIPLAEQLPNSRLLGFDLSQQQAIEGQAWISLTGLKNVEILHLDIEEFDERYGLFDYILCHGVLSWVPSDVQTAILKICSHQLSPQGIAFISYNVRPGWNTRSSIRDMLMYRVRNESSPASQIATARKFLMTLMQHLPQTISQDPFLKRELELIAKQPDAYLYHEYLEKHNQAFYFHEFCDRMQTFGLQYLCEAEAGSSVQWNHVPELVQAIERMQCDPIEMEQYGDFLSNRMFRQSLVCRSEHALDRNFRISKLDGLYIESFLVPTSESDSTSNSVEATYRDRRTGQPFTLQSPHAVVRMAFDILAEHGNSGCELNRLVTEAVDRFANPTNANSLVWQQLIAATLMQTFYAGKVTFRTWPGVHATQIATKPTASVIARSQLARGNIVTSLLHRSIRLSDWEAKLLSLLDGTRSIPELIDLLRQAHESGEMCLSTQSSAISKELNSTDSDRTTAEELNRLVISETLKRTLVAFVRQALLVSR
jgi:methyltransferase-like protein/2-polyprenyl-3-methyl-5-hydroxy-6-metoxy-1,4-benzoquinol methylase